MLCRRLQTTAAYFSKIRHLMGKLLAPTNFLTNKRIEQDFLFPVIGKNKNF